PFSAIAIREITLRVNDLAVSAAFWTTVFGNEVSSAAGAQSRTFMFGTTAVRLIPRAAAGASAGAGMDRFGVAVTDFTPGSAMGALQQRGIQATDNGRSGEVHVVDPDGIHCWLLPPG